MATATLERTDSRAKSEAAGSTSAGYYVPAFFPLDKAQALFDTAGKDEKRSVLCGTVYVDSKPGEENVQVLVATDTMRMLVVEVEGHGHLVGGLYRWVLRPRKDLQLLERIDGQFPNWRRVFDPVDSNPGTLAGWLNASDGRTRFALNPINEKFAFNLDFLPKVKNVEWEIYMTSAMKPFFLKSEFGKYILMPMQAPL